MKHVNSLRKFGDLQHPVSFFYPYPNFFDTSTQGFHRLPIDGSMALLDPAQLVAGFFFGLLYEVFGPNQGSGLAMQHLRLNPPV